MAAPQRHGPAQSLCQRLHIDLSDCSWLCVPVFVVVGKLDQCCVRQRCTTESSLVYTSNTDTVKCLDGNKSLQRSRVNDDYCDCLNGSDEPGFNLVVFEFGRGAAMPTACT